jgi:hypothetical protein
MIGGMKKYVFWSVIHQNNCIALTENLSRYAQGETFWKAMLSLCETINEWIPSPLTDESDINRRLKMYYETGINMVELFVEQEGKRFAVKCANSKSFLEAADEIDALMKYVETRAKTSVIDPGLKKLD